MKVREERVAQRAGMVVLDRWHPVVRVAVPGMDDLYYQPPVDQTEDFVRDIARRLSGARVTIEIVQEVVVRAGPWTPRGLRG